MKAWFLSGAFIVVVALGVFSGRGHEASASKPFEKIALIKCKTCHKTDKGKKDDLTPECGKQSEEYLKTKTYDAKKAAALQKSGLPDAKNPEFLKIKGFVCNPKAGP